MQGFRRARGLPARHAFILLHPDHIVRARAVPLLSSHRGGQEVRVRVAGKRSNTDRQSAMQRYGIPERAAGRMIFRSRPKEPAGKNRAKKEHADVSRHVHRAPKLSGPGARPCGPLLRKVVKPYGGGQGNCSSRVFVGTLPPMFCSTGSRSLNSPTYFVTPSRFTSSTR